MSGAKEDPTAADPELDELLDSALEVMMKKPESSPSDPAQTAENGSADPAAAPNMLTEEFIKEAAAQFENNMAAILGSFSGVPEDQITQEQIAQTFSKMAEAAAHVLGSAGGQPADGQTGGDEIAAAPDQNNEVTAAIAQTLQSLNTNADNLQTPFTDQDLANMFNNFSMDGQDASANMFVPFMQGMMQSLLSKEVLYPSLKELVDKYPEWLKDNETKLQADELNRYKQQQQLMQRICTELEGEGDNDAEEVRRKRFETVLQQMQQLQDLGQPPTELVGDMGLPPQGFAPPAGLTGQEAQCSLM